ncbi:hypothetical protein GCM10023196_004790 [Actinoallomurus vinaceus]|uniref:Secreted protein n=1 Tax=Actinoallomurus vinaceus TaxID=1080074 RepID=A0ABP8U4P2_9ACTN
MWAFIAAAASASSGTSTTVIPAARKALIPWASATKTGGSRHAMTTRPIPEAMISSAHVRGLDLRRVQGSREL